MPINSYDLVIFDLDGTLVNTLADLTASVNVALKAFDRPILSVEDVRKYVGDGARKLIERALNFPAPDQLDSGMTLFQEHYIKNVCVGSYLYPNVRETLNGLNGQRLSVFTNKPVNMANLLLTALDIAGYFDPVIGGGIGIPLKPAPDGVNYLCQSCGVAPERTLMVGDSVTDIQAGQLAGTATCAVSYGFRPR